MSYNRTLRISEEIKKIVSHIMQFNIKDPRILSSFITITKVEVTNDYSYCYIYVSILDKNADKKEVLNALKKASGFIRREIGRNIKLRITPEPIFKIDESNEYSFEMNKLINEVIKNDNKNINEYNEENYMN